MRKPLLLFLLLLLVSCKTTKKVEEHFTGTHYTAAELVSQLNLGRYSVIDESKIGELHIYIYDTSLAKDTGGGFYSPIVAEIVQRDTTQTITHVTDTITYTEDIKEMTEDSIDAEKKTTRKVSSNRFYWFIVILLLLVVCIYRGSRS